jgi:hypothetical protein
MITCLLSSGSLLRIVASSSQELVRRLIPFSRIINLIAFLGLCLDVPDGNTTVGNVVQVWTCWTDTVNDNQVWTLPAENLPEGY